MTHILAFIAGLVCAWRFATFAPEKLGYPDYWIFVMFALGYYIGKLRHQQWQ